MPKKKKTRKQKALADVRRKTEPAATHNATIQAHKHEREEHHQASALQAPRPQKVDASRSIATADYHYLSVDLRKTVILTAVILIAEFILKNVTGI
jgi:hypothetical protein